MRIALILLATSKYTEFISQFITSAKKYLKHDVKFFVLTDSVTWIPSNNEVKLVTRHWPNFIDAMLHRYSAILEYEKEYDCPYIVHQDIDMTYVDDVGDEIISPDWFVTESPNSSDDGDGWYTGSLLGGQCRHFLTTLSMIQSQIDHGELYPNMPEEYYLNKHTLLHHPSVVLGQEYCWPSFPSRRDAHPKILTITGTGALIGGDLKDKLEREKKNATARV